MYVWQFYRKIGSTKPMSLVSHKWILEYEEVWISNFEYHVVFIMIQKKNKKSAAKTEKIVLLMIF